MNKLLILLLLLLLCVGFAEAQLKEHSIIYTLNKKIYKKIHKRHVIKFVLYKDNIRIGEYVYYNFHHKKASKEKLERFAKAHICKFFDRLEIIP